MCLTANYLLSLLLDIFFLEVKEDEAEDVNTDHHTECTDVVGVGARDEPLILRVLQRAHAHLCCAVQACKSNAIVVNLETRRPKLKSLRDYFEHYYTNLTEYFLHVCHKLIK